MKFKKDKSLRKAKPVAGRSLSTNAYYRPAGKPITEMQKPKKEQDSTRNSSDTNVKKISTTKIFNLLIILLFGVLFFFASTLSLNPDIKLQDNSFSYRSNTEYQEEARNILSSNILSRSKLFFRSTQFESSMLEKFPEISNVQAIVPLGGRDLTVSLVLSEPLAKVYSGGESGVVDTNGILIGKQLESANDLFSIRFASPQGNFTEGSRLLTTAEVELLELLEAELEIIDAKNLPKLTIKEVLFNVADGQFEVSLNEVAYYLKLSTYANPKEQVGAAIVTIRELQENNLQPQKYIDVRVPGRVFVL